MRAVAGLVLTGGRSRRLGVDKATLLVDGERLADRSVRLLRRVADPVLEVGPSYTDAPSVRDDAPGEGPLVAVTRGAEALRARGVTSDVLVLAVDLPRVGEPVLTWLAAHPATGTVVPIVDREPQLLCARYDAAALTTARTLVDAGERSVRALLDAVPVHRADATEWGAIATSADFADVDTRADADALGVEIPG